MPHGRMQQNAALPRANGENNAGINAAQLRQGFCMLRHENSISLATQQMMSKGFQNYISWLEKKIGMGKNRFFRFFIDTASFIDYR